MRVNHCWKCGSRLAKLTSGKDKGKLRFEEREVQPGQMVRMHLICSKTYDAEQARAVAAKPRVYGHGPDRDE